MTYDEMMAAIKAQQDARNHADKAKRKDALNTNVRTVRALVRVMIDNGLESLEVGDVRIVRSINATPASNAPAKKSEAPKRSESLGDIVRADPDFARFERGVLPMKNS